MGSCCSRDDSSSSSARRQPDAPYKSNNNDNTHNNNNNSIRETDPVKYQSPSQKADGSSHPSSSGSIDGPSSNEVFSDPATAAAAASKLLRETTIASLFRDETTDPLVSTTTDDRLVLMLEGVGVKTVFDWYSGDAYDLDLNQEQKDKINRKCRRTNTKAYSILVGGGLKSLTPGTSHRHTTPFAYGALARDEVMDTLVTEVQGFSSEANKEDLGCSGTHGPPRQGKTRFGDELGHNKNFYGRLNGGKATADNTFIFNVTMNSNWQAAIDPDDAERKSGAELFSLTKRELCRRIVGAAVGIYKDGQYVGAKAAVCEAFIEARDCNFKKVCRDVQQIVAKKGSVNIEDSNFVFVFDEITNLEEFFDKHTDRDALKTAFYSMITSLIGYNCLVFLSGFTDVRKSLSASGRKFHSVKLSPISSARHRRELHTMKSKFFQFCAKNLLSEPHKDDICKKHLGESLEKTIFYFELVKSAPGLLGTLLEEIQRDTVNCEMNPKPNQYPATLSELVTKIPRISTLKDKDVKSMSKILQLKSLLFSSNNSANIKKQINDFVNAILERAVKNKVADSSFSGGVADLRLARLEPLFVNAAGEKLSCSVVDEYWTQLETFSGIESRIVVKEDDTKTNDCVVSDEKDLYTVFKRFRTIHSVDATSKRRIEDLMNRTFKNDEMVLETHLRGCFFEDSIVTGLLAQRQLRRQAMSSFPELKEVLPNPSATLSEYLHGSIVVHRITEGGRSSIHFPEGSILWNPNSLPSSSAAASSSSPSASASSAASSPSAISLATSIIEFDGHFPCVDKANTNDIISAQCDSLDCVLVPRRLQSNKDGIIQQEHNPLVDVIINERFSDDSQASSGDELVQFWIDGKHRYDRFFGVSKELNIDNINAALKEIARRVTVEKEGEKKSNIRHIVHIIITPFKENSPETDAKVGELRRPNKSVSLPSPLKSYTLCFVSPDDLTERKAFENLVSQPIALTIPLMDQQMTDSWTRRLPAPAEWWTYNATDGCRSRVRSRLKKMDGALKKKEGTLLHEHCPVASRMTTSEEFTQWRAIRFNGDCAIGIGHLFGTEKEAREQLSFKGAIKDQPHRSMEIPFGCILEALGILPPRAHGTSYCEYNQKHLRFKLRLLSSNTSRSSSSSSSPSASAAASLQEPAASSLPPLVHSSASRSTLFEISIIGQQSVEQKPFDSVTVDSEWLLDQIRVGHILRFDHSLTKEQMKVDYEESDGMSELWKKKFEEYRGLAWRMSSEGEKKGWISLLESKEQMTTMTCSDLWNMSLREFKEVFMVRSKNKNSNKDNNTTRKSKSVQNNNDDDDAATAPLKMTQQDCDDIVSAFLTGDDESRKRAVANLCNYIKVCDFKLKK